MSYSHCINPQCPQPQNAETQMFCQSCGGELLVGGAYRVFQKLGGGGFGNTYEVRSGDGENLVLKVLHYTNDEALRLFRQEAEVLQKLNHEGIPKVREDGYFTIAARGNCPELHCLLMEKIEGQNLLDWVKQRGQPIDINLAIKWLKELTLILQEVHKKRFFHRDIKPANVMLRATGKLALIDFGTVREITATYMAKQQAGQVGTMVYSRGYAPAEQENGHTVPQSDFYAMGRTFVYLLTGRHPLEFYDPQQDRLNWRLALPNLPAIFGDFLDDLMSRLPGDRPADTATILGRLAQIEQILFPPARSVAPQRSPSALSPRVVKPHKQPLKVTANIRAGGMGAGSPWWGRLWGGAVALGLGTGLWLVLGNGPWQRAIGGGLLVGSAGVGALRREQIQNALFSPSPGVQARRQAIQTLNPKKHLVRSIPLSGSLVSALAISPDGGYWAVPQDKNIRIARFPDGKEMALLKGHENEVYDLCFSPDGEWLASGSWDRTVNLWRWTTGELAKTLKGHSGYVTTIAFSPDGQTLASAGWDKTIKLWHLTSGQEIRTLKGHDHYIEALAFSADGLRLASGGQDKTVRIWEVAGGKELEVLRGHGNTVRSVAFSPNGEWLASGSWDKTVKLWQVQTGKLLHNLSSHTDYVRSVLFTEDSQVLISASHDRTIRLWDPERGRLVKIYRDHEDWVTAITLHPNGYLLLSASRDQTIKMWNLG